MVYATGERELYDLMKDPNELTNEAGNPASGAVVNTLASALARLCRPPPPGMPKP